ncbi:Sterol desaturase/sphingolipid hydroxylase, fatty acid hydroxylase superfamily [Parasphingorhabdus marina DSM 22363]|uniref:Sterol desaturase/sphingolipid hydroxylase, fatty acid hydroxylase superfamily n=1 Tax=Parasphingorhabdus marina DSM 22363 TaxID=1123272 RepID=A0A1N6GMT5_9SPHN|nr:sterol desaturase family protein [Parasphingorhabdus marina]SIO08772.1 Sterol desaturase/sphingolipid hydroxylase, fatty acid hydroxylase superfamily [Parasphingorhabdus marina DSM 22363]
MDNDPIMKLAYSLEDGFFLIGIAMLAIEMAKSLFSGRFKGRKLLDILASISTQIPSILAETFLLSFVYAGFVLLSDNFISWTLPVNIWTILAVLLAADFVYYWEHRIAHEVRLFWTQHAVHHSSREMNIAVAIRFGSLEGVISAILHLPLILIGFPAELVFFGIIAVLAYQVWIHTELIGKLPVLDSFLNTPANHRVHHGCDDKYIDTNYGGILIVWDRLFGTYQREEETPNYGLKRDFQSVNPLVVWFSELPQFFRDIAGARSWRDALMFVFGPPGWKPNAENLSQRD